MMENLRCIPTHIVNAVEVMVIRGTAVEIIVLSTATHKVAKHSTIEIKTTLENLTYLLVSSVS